MYLSGKGDIMRKVKFEMKIETIYKGNCSLKNLLEYASISEAEWDALTKKEQENLIYNYYEDEIFEIMASYDTMNYSVKIKN